MPDRVFVPYDSSYEPDQFCNIIFHMKLREKRISVSEFKAKCLRILEELDSDGILITKRGAAARPRPTVSSNESLIGSMKGAIVVKGSLFSTGAKWNAESPTSFQRGL